MTKNQRLVYIALLASQAVMIGLIERAIPFPFPVPGAKLGLANVIICIALYTLPTKDAFSVVITRITLATLLGGTLSTFMFSASGALLSFWSMLSVKKLGPKRVSLIGVSITGAIFHHIGQLFVASWIAKTFVVFLYLPILSFVGFLSGIAIGFAANYVFQHVEKLKYYKYLQGNNFLT